MVHVVAGRWLAVCDGLIRESAVSDHVVPPTHHTVTSVLQTSKAPAMHTVTLPDTRYGWCQYTEGA